MLQLPDSPPTKRERVAIEKACRDSAAFRQKVRERCSQDVAWFINCFGFTFDPRPEAENPDLPFILYDYQVDTLRWLDARLSAGEDGIIEKSRDMGLTWTIVVGWLVHKWLFHRGFQGLVGSRKEDLVDNRMMDSHFGKLEYFIDMLPGWLQPRGYDPSKHRHKLKLTNPENGNAIIGESANAQFSRQGRYTVIVFDEAAFWEDLTSAWRAAGSATNCRIANSTANGMNAFARIRFAKNDDGGEKYKVLTLHARIHPKKGPEWVAKQRARMTAEDFAQEIDISYERSTKGVVYPTWREIPKGSYGYKRGYSLYVSWDFGIADDTAIIWWARDPQSGMVRMIDSYSNAGKPIDFYVPFVAPEHFAELQGRYQYDDHETQLINRHALWPKPIHYGDPAGKQRNQVTATSVIDALKQWKIYVQTNDEARSFRERKTQTELGLRLLEGWDEVNCAEVDDAMTNAKFPDRNPDSRSTQENHLPIHDWTSHYRTAVEYFFVNIPPIYRTRRPVPTERKMAYDRL